MTPDPRHNSSMPTSPDPRHNSSTPTSPEGYCAMQVPTSSPVQDPCVYAPSKASINPPRSSGVPSSSTIQNQSSRSTMEIQMEIDTNTNSSFIFLANLNLVAEAAKRAKMAILARDMNAAEI
ncbi:hypothetical protein K3495_g5284 [Podosphaera aphanis]|nr:hypothetical protein K3495_g5284 [Podosphaera aphanis]